jgi:hypothetical protein
VSAAAAAKALETAKRLAAQPILDAAARAGDVSPEQAAVISDAVQADPSAESRLVETAQSSTMADLRGACARTKVAADANPDATHERIRKARRLWEWTDQEVAWNLGARGVPEDGAVIHAALKAKADELFEQARKEGRREPHEAYMYDALLSIMREHLGLSDEEIEAVIDNTDLDDGMPAPGTDGPVGPAPSGGPSAGGRATPPSPVQPPPTPPSGKQPKRPKWLGIIRVDIEALIRGFVEGDEVCEIPGVGPISVAVARQLLGDAIFELVITKGNDVVNTTYLGRGPNAAQRIALLWQGIKCFNEACDRTWRQVDHREEFRRTRVTRLDNLDLLCDEDHDLKTYRGWALVEGKGRRQFVPPDHPRHPKNVAAARGPDAAGQGVDEPPPDARLDTEAA